MPEKTCLGCGDPFTREGKQTQSKYCCIECAERTHRATQRALIRALIDGFKTTSGCAVCGLAAPAYILDCHHLDPATKHFSLGAAAQRGRGVDAVRAELAKCVVLCSNHHRMVEAGDVVLPPCQGTPGLPFYGGTY